jgi:outer membrane protein assembly factor BamB
MPVACKEIFKAMKLPRLALPFVLLFALLCALAAHADDWPQWRGPNRDGVWNETGIREAFPRELPVRWRAPVGGGLSSPVVAQHRVYVTDSEVVQPKAWERVHCFDETSGKSLWIHSDEVDYPEWARDPKQKSGPQSTPIVDDGKIYALGVTGWLWCLNASDGAVIWKKNLANEYELPEFSGTTPSPLIEGGRLILVIGGKPSACVIALDKNTGKELWRALDDQWTYSSPIVANAGGKRQLIVWTGEAVTSLDPATGTTFWRERMETRRDYATATPVVRGDLLLVSGLMFRLDRDKPAASVLWPESKALSRRVLSQTSLPLIQGDCVYCDKSYGHLVCLDALTGKQLWQTDQVTDQKNGACIHLTPNGDSVLLYNERGELIRARLDAKGYTEISRARLLTPTYPFAGRKVTWSPPAFANRHVFARNDEEIVCASLEP